MFSIFLLHFFFWHNIWFVWCVRLRKRIAAAHSHLSCATEFDKYQWELKKTFFFGFLLPSIGIAAEWGISLMYRHLSLMCSASRWSPVFNSFCSTAFVGIFQSCTSEGYDGKIWSTNCNFVMWTSTKETISVDAFANEINFHWIEKPILTFSC